MEETRRFRMIGQTVCIHCPREEWSDLKGRFGTVTNQWGDGRVCVEVERWYGSKARISFARSEVEHVAMNDFMRHRADEECALILRAVALGSLAGRCSPHGPLSERLNAACERRSQRIQTQILAIQRLRGCDLARTARLVALGIGNYCTAIVPYAGGAA